ncbi:MAG: sulfite exporter TauE/SafE family protein [archaeon]
MSSEIRITIKGMTCVACENLITRELKKLPGVEEVNVNYARETAEIKFDKTKTSLADIVEAIEVKGYECTEGVELVEKTEKIEEITEKVEKEIEKEQKIEHTSNPKKLNYKYLSISIGILILMIGAYFILKSTTGLNLPELGPGTSLALIFVIGLLTGFHCIAMCGGFVVSYTAKEATENNKLNLKSHLAYGAGKTITYTAIGAIFGLIGSIFTFTPQLRGIAGIIAGIFLVLFGINMLGIFKWTRYLQMRGPKFLNSLPEKSKSRNPLVIGLLNGLMIACGPLQAMYIFAAATGSITQGALTMLVFGLGTLPVMIGFGVVASLVSSQLTKKILKASAIVVIILGVVMLNRGLVLAGQPNLSNIVSFSGEDTNTVSVQNGVQEINMDVTANGYSPNKFVLQKGVPVKWNINVKELTGCNKEIIVPTYNLDVKLKQGMNTVEFTPDKEGTVSWSCWMGMLRGAFVVKADLGTQAEQQKELAAVNAPKGMQCGGSSGGGCGCGG